MWPDPRSHRRYTQLSAAWIAALGGRPVPCCLCGRLVDTAAPRTSKRGPTIEHRNPIRVIRATAPTYEAAVALACDTSQWGIAHLGCQQKQGGRTSGRHARKPRETAAKPSREW